MAQGADGSRADAVSHTSEMWYRLIVETAAEGICIVDENNDIVFANRRLAAMTGHHPDDLIGRSADILVADDDRAKARDDFNKRRTGALDRDVRLRRADGSTVWTTMSSSLMHTADHQFTGMLRVYTDASARHELAESRQRQMRDLIAAQERERERIARELHDQMGQHVVALALGVAKLARLTEQNEQAQNTLSQLREIADLLGRDVHTLAFQLRPATLTHLGLAVALTSYVQDVATRSGIEIDVHCDDVSALKLSSATQTGLYRIAQEAVTNAVKHARARRVSLIVERRDDGLLLIVEDDGVGYSPRTESRAAGSGFGISGMRERAALLGGTLSIESTAGRGTTVYVHIPVVDDEHTASHPAR